MTVYPNESDKPPIGEELNRGAEITLERVWPNDKSDHTPIKVRFIRRLAADIKFSHFLLLLYSRVLKGFN